jgi:monoamine oxidase
LPITQILYPSNGFLSRKGVLVGYYQTGVSAEQTGALPPERRLADAIAQGVQIHPQYPTELENAFSIAWQHVPLNAGGWAQYTLAQRRHEYRTLLKPDRAFFLAGDHLTYLSGWMAGAFLSARAVSAAVHERASRAPERMTASIGA